MNKKSNQIESELIQTIQRLGELTEMRNRLNNNLQTLQAGFIDGKTSLDELQTSQGGLTILTESIKSLSAKRDELHTAFQKAGLSESRQSQLEKAKETALEIEGFLGEYLKTKIDFDKSISEFTKKLNDKISGYTTKQAEFKRLSDENLLNPEDFEKVGLPSENYKTATASGINQPTLEYGQVILFAENQLATKLNYAYQAKIKSELDANRAKNQEAIKIQIEAENNKQQAATN
jgi:ribosomal protein S17E